MRKQYDGLWALASQHLRLDPKNGALFVFTNKSHDRIKLLHRDGTDVRLMAKRLEQGLFTWTATATGNACKLTLEPSAYPQTVYDGEMPSAAKLPAAGLALEHKRDSLRAKQDDHEETILDPERQLEWLRRQLFGPGKGENSTGCNCC